LEIPTTFPSKRGNKENVQPSNESLFSPQKRFSNAGKRNFDTLKTDICWRDVKFVSSLIGF
jgi:hypothetical protein